MIPKIIHQIWIGPKKPPTDWMKFWPLMNKGCKYVVWGESQIFNFGLQNFRLFQEYMKKGIYYGAADVARIEILKEYGGVFIDADTVCTNSIEDEEFMKSEFFVGEEYHKGRIANGVIGSTPNHPILNDYIEKMGRAIDIIPVWNTIGGTMLTQCIDDYGRDKITLLPTYAFYPVNHNGQKAEPIGKNYMKQFWGSTKKLY